jgi:dUTP pyrophosphatase
VFTKLHPDAVIPKYNYGSDSGFDLHSVEEITIQPFGRAIEPTGLSFDINDGYEIQVRPRSGLSLKSSLMVVNSPGTIDCDYRGEVNIIIGNFGKEDYIIEHGLRVAQLVISPVLQAKFITVDGLSETQRGSGGFGSTGTR